MPPRIPLPTDERIYLGIPDTSMLCAEFNEPAGRLYTATEALDGIEPVTRELVRMRNAKHQRCNL
jgi:hypothetical protein